MSLIKSGKVQVGQSGTSTQNFHFRNLLDGLLRLCRGNAEEVSPTEVLVVNANNSVSFPGGIAGGLSKDYVSPQQVITAGGALSLTHNLGAKPKVVSAVLICTTAEAGYSVGDEVFVTFDNQATNTLSWGMSLVRTNTTLEIRFSGTAQTFIILRKDTGAAFNITNANWRLVIGAWV